MKRETLAAEILAPQAETQGRVRDVVFYSGAKIDRYDFWSGKRWWISFSLEPGDFSLDRLNAGAPLLDTHQRQSITHQLGVTEKGWMESPLSKATVRFSKRESVTPIWNDVEDGIIKNLSMGVNINQLKDVTPRGSKEKELLAIGWEPQEISLASVGADGGAHILQALFSAVPPGDDGEKMRRFMQSFLKQMRSGKKEPDEVEDLSGQLALDFKKEGALIDASQVSALAKLRIHSARLRLQ